MSNKKDIVTLDPELLAQLDASYPKEKSRFSIQLKKLGMFSQDITEKVGKKIEIINEAGEFYIEQASEELDENGKAVWKKDSIGTSIEALIVYKRYQLSYYDDKSETFYSTPVYDSADDVVPLFNNLTKQEVSRGTASELKTLKEFLEVKDGKTVSKLKDNRVLYVLFNDELYQLTIKGSSMYAYMDYEKKIGNPTRYLTVFNSTPRENGSIKWNQMTFEAVRSINPEELTRIVEEVNKIKTAIAISKASYETAKPKEDDDKAFNALVESATGKM